MQRPTKWFDGFRFITYTIPYLRDVDFHCSFPPWSKRSNWSGVSGRMDVKEFKRNLVKSVGGCNEVVDKLSFIREIIKYYFDNCIITFYNNIRGMVANFNLSEQCV